MTNLRGSSSHASRIEEPKDDERTYRYTARKLTGETVRGKAKADSPEELYELLRDKGLYLQSCRRSVKFERRAKLSYKTLSEFSRELSTLLAAGISLVKAISMLAQEEGISAAEKKLYLKIQAEIERGNSLSQAMDAQEAFPELMIGMVRAGEGTGNLDGVLARLAIHYMKQAQMEEQVRSALMYPAILSVLAVAVVMILFTFVIPQFEDLFAEMPSLPLPTVILLGISGFVRAKWYLLIILVVLAVVAARSIVKIPKVRLRLDRAKLHIPVVGGLNQIICSARFGRTLSSLYSSGTTIIFALQTSRDTIGNAYIASRFEKALEMVRSGSTLSKALSEIQGFREKLISSIQVGEETGQLDAILNDIADAMEYDAQQATKRLMTILEPLLIVIMALIVGFIMIGVMLPIIQSYSAIGA